MSGAPTIIPALAQGPDGHLPTSTRIDLPLIAALINMIDRMKIQIFSVKSKADIYRRALTMLLMRYP